MRSGETKKRMENCENLIFFEKKMEISCEIEEVAVYLQLKGVEWDFSARPIV